MPQNLTKLSFTLSLNEESVNQLADQDNGDGGSDVTIKLGAPDKWPDMFLPDYLSLSMQEADDKDDLSLYDVAVWFDAPIDIIALTNKATKHGFDIANIDIDREIYAAEIALADNFVQQEERDLLPLGTVDILRKQEPTEHAAHQDISAGNRGNIHLWSPQAFGDGFHPTTHMCLQTLEALYGAEQDSKQDAQSTPQQHNVLDAGTGSGILSLLAYALWQAPVHATDIEEDAVKALDGNWKRNGFAPKDLYNTCRDDLQDQAILDAASYTIACCNMVKEPLLKLVLQIAALQQKGALLILSGYLHDQESEINKAALAAGYVLASQKQEGDWICGLFEKQ